VIVVER